MAERTIQILIETAVQGTERVQSAANAAEGLAKAEKKAEEAAGEAGDAFGKAGETAGKLGGGLELVGVTGAQTVADLADVGEVAAQALEGASASVLTLAGALAVLVAAYAITQRGVERINAQFQLEKTLSAELRDSYDKMASVGFVDALQGKDLQVSGRGKDMQVSFAYEKRIPLIGPTSLLIEYKGSTAQDVPEKAAN